MNLDTISIMGDRFCVASCDRDFDRIISYAKEENVQLVSISPSLVPDFKAELFFRGNWQPGSELSLAMAAGAHLFHKKGLPLDEIDFEVGDNIIRIFNTDSDHLSIFIRKSKQKFTKNEAFVKGCNIHYTDVDLYGKLRIVEVEDLLNFDRETLALFSCPQISNSLSAVAAATLCNNKIDAVSYSEFSEYPLPRFHVATALASYFHKPYGREKDICVDGFSCSALSLHGGVFLKLKPVLI